jgi:hypothetical protein
MNKDLNRIVIYFIVYVMYAKKLSKKRGRRLKTKRLKNYRSKSLGVSKSLGRNKSLVVAKGRSP